ncbi:MBL fold metallo-hydrolase [Paenibacillus ginsengarvi]|uniref:MBL fold metallo-hydrolase n=1 Tax=Paenibacillus ginsengarvi TaxID=400777 RepID=A0A3B0BZ70_9BACL|nr:MBL fold metallo-hydrolase [Paenibacillus ginsengarvi]RKN78220.1 MBL fold metallo-hydrolase [Paenibacillus ginsengarvi]
MRLTKMETLYQLSFMPRLFPVNCYFVEEADGLTLIDAALPYSAKAIIGAAERLGKPIARIVLTHAHSDHIGALDALKTALPAVPVYISARDSRLLAGDVSLDPDEPQTPVRGGVPKNVRTRADVLLADGDRIGSLQAVAVPGHTPGSMAFLDTRSRAVFVGDALQTRGGVAVSGQLKPLFPFPAMATWNKQAALASAQKLKELRPTLLAAGHGRMLVQPLAVLERAINEAAHSLEAAAGERSV